MKIKQVWNLLGEGMIIWLYKDLWSKICAEKTSIQFIQSELCKRNQETRVYLNTLILIYWTSSLRLSSIYQKNEFNLYFLISPFSKQVICSRCALVVWLSRLSKWSSSKMRRSCLISIWPSTGSWRNATSSRKGQCGFLKIEKQGFGFGIRAE